MTRGVPSLQRLAQRAQLTRPGDIDRATLALPAVYYAFDLLFAEGRDLRALPLAWAWVVEVQNWG